MIGGIFLLELRLLNYFLVLSEELHYTKAAERLHISQPTLSNQIKILESIVGAPLFKYASKKTTLTEEGKILQQHAYKIFFDIEQTKADIKNFSGKQRTQITIGASGCHLILHPCSQFNKSHPDILLTMEEHSSNTIINNVKNGKLDIGVIYSSVDSPSIYSEVLNLDPYLVVTSKSSELAQYESIELKTLIDKPIVSLAQTSSSRKIVNKSFSYINHTLTPIIQVANLTSCITLIENTNNISILPKSFLKTLNNPNIKSIPISDYPPIQTINLIYRKDLFIDSILTDLLNIIRTFHSNKITL